MTGSSPLRPLLLGIAAGLRTFTPWAALGVRGRLAGGRAVRRATVALALGEWVGDKVPQVPPRTQPGPLVARLLSGAVAGGLVDGRRGVALGAGGALAGAFGGQHGRAALGRALRRPDPVIAVGEDALAAALAVTAA
jgi:uncharacterized membrane protein